MNYYNEKTDIIKFELFKCYELSGYPLPVNFEDRVIVWSNELDVPNEYISRCFKMARNQKAIPDATLVHKVYTDHRQTFMHEEQKNNKAIEYKPDHSMSFVTGQITNRLLFILDKESKSKYNKGKISKYQSFAPDSDTINKYNLNEIAGKNELRQYIAEWEGFEMYGRKYPDLETYRNVCC